MSQTKTKIRFWAGIEIELEWIKLKLGGDWEKTKEDGSEIEEEPESEEDSQESTHSDSAE